MTTRGCCNARGHCRPGKRVVNSVRLLQQALLRRTAPFDAESCRINRIGDIVDFGWQRLVTPGIRIVSIGRYFAVIHERRSAQRLSAAISSRERGLQMQRMHFRLMGVGFMALLCVYPAMGAATQPPLGASLPQFGVLAGAAASGSTGSGTTVNGDVGSGIGTVNNFPPSSTVAPFTFSPSVAVVAQALLDARAAWVDMGTQGTLPGAIPLGAQLDGVTLTSGVYTFSSTADLAATGTLTLNGPGIFIFDVGTSLTANVGSRVVGTANPCNIYWRMGPTGSATLNGNNFWGTVIADQSVTVSSSNTLTGRAVGIVAAVTMPGSGGNTIGGCTAGAVVPPPAGLACVPGLTASGAPGTETVTLSAPAPPGGTVVFLTSSAPGMASVPFSVVVPAGATSVTFTVTPGATPGTVTITATSASGSVTCTFTVATLGGPGSGTAGGPTLDSFGLAILLALLAAAGLFAVNRFSS